MKRMVVTLLLLILSLSLLPAYDVMFLGGFGDIGKIEEALTDGMDINEADEIGYTLLYYAAMFENDPEVVEYIIEQGASFESSAEGIETPLIAAIIFSDYETVKVMVDHGADVNSPYMLGITPLMEAAQSAGNLNVLRLLLLKGADIKAQSMMGENVLNFALLNPDDYRRVAMLIAAGADAANLDVFDDSLIAYAVRYRCTPQIITLLIDAGADPNITGWSAEGKTPLITAAQMGEDPELIMALLDGGADGSKTCDRGFYAYEYAKVNPYLKDTKAYDALYQARIKRVVWPE